MIITGIEKGDKDLRHFTFDDGDYEVRGGVYFYKVNYGKNKLEGEYAEDEISYVRCDKVIPLGGKKPKPIPQKKTEVAQVVETKPVEEKPKRGRPSKVTKLPETNEVIQVKQDGAVQYEYLVSEFEIDDALDLQKGLNKLGSEGWELCCCDFDKSLFTNKVRTVFKRKRG